MWPYIQLLMALSLRVVVEERDAAGLLLVHTRQVPADDLSTQSCAEDHVQEGVAKDPVFATRDCETHPHGAQEEHEVAGRPLVGALVPMQHVHAQVDEDERDGDDKRLRAVLRPDAFHDAVDHQRGQRTPTVPAIHAFACGGGGHEGAFEDAGVLQAWERLLHNVVFA
jgi:hypothetical protein